MKITPIDIQQQQFRRTMRGYDPQEVNTFLELVAQELGDLSRAHNELKVELRHVEKELAEHRDREQTLKEAMLTAQRAIDEIREQAERQAELIVADADLRAERLLLNAHKRVSAILEDVQELKRQRVRAIEEMRSLINSQARMLDVLEKEKSLEGEEASITVLDRVRAPRPPQLAADGPGKSAVSRA